MFNKSCKSETLCHLVESGETSDSRSFPKVKAYQSIRKIAEDHSEYEIIAHQSIRKFAEDHSEYEIFTH